jgi:hypothetical protein
MHVPLQQNAPSLSPRQSFGFQSPLPWVTGTDRIRSLRALWQLQGSFQEFSLSHAHSLTWRESLTGQQASRSPVLRSLNNPMGKQTQAFQKLDSITGWLHSHGFRIGNARIGLLSFPEQAKNLPRIQNRLLVGWGYMHGISQNQTQTFQSQGLPPKVLYRSRVSHTAQSSVRVQTIRWNGNQNLLTAHPGHFIRMHQG